MRSSSATGTPHAKKGALPAAAGEGRRRESANNVRTSRATDDTLLEMPGIEPGSSGGNTGLLRVQLAVVFSAPPFTRARRCRAQSLFDFPSAPVTGSDGDPPVDARSRAGGTPGLTATL